MEIRGRVILMKLKCLEFCVGSILQKGGREEREGKGKRKGKEMEKEEKGKEKGKEKRREGTQTSYYLGSCSFLKVISVANLMSDNRTENHISTYHLPT